MFLGWPLPKALRSECSRQPVARMGNQMENTRTEPHELAAGVAGNVFQIAPHHLRHVPRHDLPQAGDNAVHIQLQNTQQGADEDQQREK